MKTIQNTTVHDIAGKTIPVKDNDGNNKEGNVADIFQLLIINLRPDALTMGDVVSANRIWKVMDKAGEVIEIEDADFTWLKKITDSVAPKIFGINAIILSEALE